eukprot:1248821-Alexandrium_andersonii.AAC.1
MTNLRGWQIEGHTKEGLVGAHGRARIILAVARCPVARLRGGPVTQWPGGPVARWPGGPVARWLGGSVARWPGCSKP